MDLTPLETRRLVAAASNVAHSVLYGGVADLRPMPRALIDDGELREVYHYRPDREIGESGDPVLLVSPLAAPALCYDLRRGCSLVEHLVGRGRRTYAVEYGAVSFRNRALGMAHWVDEVLPESIRAVSEHAGGRPVHVVGWSLGGIFAMLAAADQPDLPIASLSILGSPVDVRRVPLVAPVRPLLDLTQGRGVLARAYGALGGIPVPLAALTAATARKVLAKPLAIATHLDDADYLAQLVAVDRFMGEMTAYPGRTFGQLYHRMAKGNALALGSIELGDRTISLSSITAPVLVFAGATDGIAPVAAVKAVVALLSSAREVRFEIVPGGHLGMLTGRAARDTTWLALDEWVARWEEDAPRRSRRRATTDERATPKKSAPKKSAPKKSAPKGPGKKSSSKKSTSDNVTGSAKRVTDKTAPKAANKAGKKVTESPSKTATKKPAGTKNTVKKTAKNSAKSKAKETSTGRRSGASASSIGANPNRRYGSKSSRSL